MKRGTDSLSGLRELSDRRNGSGVSRFWPTRLVVHFCDCSFLVLISAPEKAFVQIATVQILQIKNGRVPLGVHSHSLPACSVWHNLGNKPLPGWDPGFIANATHF